MDNIFFGAAIPPSTSSVDDKTRTFAIDNPWLLLATLPLYHPVQDLKMTPLLQFTPVHFLKSTPLPLLTPVCNFEALLGASLISMNQQVLLRPGTPVL